ncbi:reverse transcriptase domain-containing protein [Tanacetum coccineum]
MSSEGIHHKPFVPTDDSRPPRQRGRPRGVKNRFKGVKIKVQSLGSASAGAGAILKKLRNSKMVGKGRSHSDSSPNDVISGKRANSNPCPVDDVLVKGVIDYRMGSSKKSVNEGYYLINGNDGSFINKHSEPVVDDVNGDCKSRENKGDCVSDSVDPCLVSNGASKLNMADGEHVGVESTSKAGKDGCSGVKGDSGFVFGNVKSNKGILKKPTMGLTSVQFGPSLFYKSSSVWSSYNSSIKAMKSDGSLNIESFAEKMKKGRVYEVAEITKTSAGLFYFKFKNEEGMKVVLESGPWMACVYGLPMELCNGNGIGKVFSSIGKPMLIDKLTKERCLKNARKLDFVRVLVEVSASDDLPDFLEIEYPKIGDRPARVGKLEVKYKWNPPFCTHCKTFGHATMSCKVRPRTEEEIAAKASKEAMKSGDSVSIKSNDGKCDDDDFVTVERKGKANATQSNDKQFVMKNRNFYGNFRQNFSRQGPNQQNT